MNGTRTYRQFVHHEACLRICCDQFDVVASEIVRQRKILDAYISRHPRFRTSLTPLTVSADDPEVVRRMAHAGQRVGVGPMAAVAGAMAQLAVEAAVSAGAREAIVDNGGDIYLVAAAPVTIALYTGRTPLADHLAFSVQPEDTPISICSSSGMMGPSFSMGKCDLATIVARDAALADAAATEAANRVRSEVDIDVTLRAIAGIEGVDGVLLVKGERIGLMGRLPPLVRNLQGRA